MGQTQTRITPTLVDIATAAQQLSVTVRFMRRLVDERRIPYFKIGKYVRFDPADLARFVQSGRVDAAPVHAVSARR